MKMILMMVAIAGLCVGCEAPQTLSGTPTLFDCSQPAFHPNAGTIYRHDGRYLIVFQVMDGAVMVAVGMGAPARSSFGQLDFIVETSQKYVDREMLAPGKYEYVGPYTYETVQNKKRTIRHFKEVE